MSTPSSRPVKEKAVYADITVAHSSSRAHWTVKAQTASIGLSRKAPRERPALRDTTHRFSDEAWLF